MNSPSLVSYSPKIFQLFQINKTFLTFKFARSQVLLYCTGRAEPVLPLCIPAGLHFRSDNWLENCCVPLLDRHVLCNRGSLCCCQRHTKIFKIFQTMEILPISVRVNGAERSWLQVVKQKPHEAQEQNFCVLKYGDRDVYWLRIDRFCRKRCYFSQQKFSIFVQNFSRRSLKRRSKIF